MSRDARGRDKWRKSGEKEKKKGEVGERSGDRGDRGSGEDQTPLIHFDKLVNSNFFIQNI